LILLFKFDIDDLNTYLKEAKIKNKFLYKFSKEKSEQRRQNQKKFIRTHYDGLFLLRSANELESVKEKKFSFDDYFAYLKDKTTIEQAFFENEKIEMSTGENLILLILLWKFHAKLLEEQNKDNKPIKVKTRLLLLDEPDSHMHPSLIKDFLDLVSGEDLKYLRLQVILTTHNPVSVLLMKDQESIFYMSKSKKETENEYEFNLEPVKNKHQAISLLTEDLVSVKAPTRIVFVEGQDDKDYYEALDNFLVKKGVFSKDQINRLVFLSHGTKNKKNARENSCRSTVEDLVEKCTNLQNIDYNNNGLVDSIYGLVDNDNKPCLKENIFCLERYAIENYIYDPIMVLFYHLVMVKKQPIIHLFKMDKLDLMNYFQGFIDGIRKKFIEHLKAKLNELDKDIVRRLKKLQYVGNDNKVNENKSCTIKEIKYCFDTKVVNKDSFFYIKYPKIFIDMRGKDFKQILSKIYENLPDIKEMIVFLKENLFNSEKFLIDELNLHRFIPYDLIKIFQNIKYPKYDPVKTKKYDINKTTFMKAVKYLKANLNDIYENNKPVVDEKIIKFLEKSRAPKVSFNKLKQSIRLILNGNFKIEIQDSEKFPENIKNILTKFLISKSNIKYIRYFKKEIIFIDKSDKQIVDENLKFEENELIKIQIFLIKRKYEESLDIISKSNIERKTKLNENDKNKTENDVLFESKADLYEFFLKLCTELTKDNRPRIDIANNADIDAELNMIFDEINKFQDDDESDILEKLKVIFLNQDLNLVHKELSELMPDNYYTDKEVRNFKSENYLFNIINVYFSLRDCLKGRKEFKKFHEFDEKIKTIESKSHDKNVILQEIINFFNDEFLKSLNDLNFSDDTLKKFTENGKLFKKYLTFSYSNNENIQIDLEYPFVMLKSEYADLKNIYSHVFFDKSDSAVFPDLSILNSFLSKRKEEKLLLPEEFLFAMKKKTPLEALNLLIKINNVEVKQFELKPIEQSKLKFIKPEMHIKQYYFSPPIIDKFLDDSHFDEYKQALGNSNDKLNYLKEDIEKSLGNFKTKIENLKIDDANNEIKKKLDSTPINSPETIQIKYSIDYASYFSIEYPSYLLKFDHNEIKSIYKLLYPSKEITDKTLIEFINRNQQIIPSLFNDHKKKEKKKNEKIVTDATKILSLETKKNKKNNEHKN
jgi:hypothetical protein